MWPPCLFALIWAFEMLAIPLTNYLQVSVECQLFYLLGALAFTAGGYIAMWLPAPGLAPKMTVSPVVLKLFIVTDVVLAVLFVREVIELVKTVVYPNFFFAARVAFLEQPDTTFVENAVPFAMILATIFALQDDGSRKARFATFSSVTLAFILNLLTGGRWGAAVLALMLVVIAWFKKRLSWKYLAAIGVAVGTLFIVIIIALAKGVDPYGSFRENVPLLGDSILSYAVTGPIIFDHVYHSPTIVPPAWHPDRVFVQAANKLGARLEQPNINAEFINYTATRYTNVYTMYFAYYPHYGYVLTLVIVGFLGFMCVLIYRKAKTGAPWAVLISSALFAAVLLSPYNEQFFLALNYMGKTILMCWLLYRREGSQSLLSRWAWRKAEFNRGMT